MTSMEKAMRIALDNAVAENQHDTAIRFTLLVNGIDMGNFLGEDEYVWAVDSRTSGPDVISFYTTDNKGLYSQVEVDLEKQEYRTRLDEEGWGWSGWYSC